MADFQYFPDMDDPVAKLRMAMNGMDGVATFSSLLDVLHSFIWLDIAETLCSYSMSRGLPADSTPIIPEPDSNLDPQLLELSQPVPLPPKGLRLFPPPLFSRQTIPQGYKFVLFPPMPYVQNIMVQ